MRFRLYIFSLLLGTVLFACEGGCNPPNEERSAPKLMDTPLENYQVELLNIAFKAASAMPLKPHIKSRSKTQEVVVMACLDLGQPKKALGYIEQIKNWRRELCYAELAFYCAKHELKDQAEQFSGLAMKVPQNTEQWRKEKIDGKISKIDFLPGQNKETEEPERNLESSESEKVPRMETMSCPEDSFEKKMEELEKLVSTKNFDVVRSVLGEYTELYSRHYTETERRTLIENKIKAAWTGIPISIRIDSLKELANRSLSRKDRTKALELVNEAEVMMDSATWQLRYEIPLMAELAELRFLSGDKKSARNKIHEALNLFDTNCEKIVNIYRAQVLRSIAETYQGIGETAVAHDIYKRALEAGIENPNSRPRAEDLSAICCSMALHKAEPGAELFGRIREICDGLGDPW